MCGLFFTWNKIVNTIFMCWNSDFVLGLKMMVIISTCSITGSCSSSYIVYPDTAAYCMIHLLLLTTVYCYGENGGRREFEVLERSSGGNQSRLITVISSRVLLVQC
jgi:hypothetical protein